MDRDDMYPREGFNEKLNLKAFDACRGCGRTLLPENRRIADGCPCNGPRGLNHGLVAKNTCTCVECDPAQTGSTRIGSVALVDEIEADKSLNP